MVHFTAMAANFLNDEVPDASCVGLLTNLLARSSKRRTRTDEGGCPAGESNLHAVPHEGEGSFQDHLAGLPSGEVSQTGREGPNEGGLVMHRIESFFSANHPEHSGRT